MSIAIGITDCKKYAMYERWVRPLEVEIVRLTPENSGDLKKCQGVVLTGGEDVHPRLYKKPEYFEYCNKDDVNEARDAFEWTVLEYIEANGIPLLGICRGLQLGNVFFGGTLIPDIPTWGKYNHSHLPDGSDRYHSVQVDPTSWLHGIVGIGEGIVNSFHHQSVDRVAGGLVVAALSPDGVVEALERTDPRNKSFLCLVQWHPERMMDQQSVFTCNILQAFVAAATQSKKR
jgi:putative glutamine amidotransferase